MKKKIAILGAGFIGKNLIGSYISSGTLLSVLDHNRCPDELTHHVQWQKGNLENSADILKTIKGAEIVFHFISSTVPGDSVDENEEIIKNVTETINLLRLCVQENVKRIVFISSASVYGIKHNLPIDEEASTDPISSHGIHKLTIEKYLQLYKYNYGLDCKIMRLSNPYGWGQNIFGRQGIIAIAIGKIISGDPITIMGDGNAIRDFIYIDDVINAYHLLAETKSNEIVFNIGSGAGLSINEVVHELQKLTNNALKIRHVENRKNDISTSVLDINKAKKVLGFKVNTSFRSGLKKTLSLYAKYHPKLNKTLDIK